MLWPKFLIEKNSENYYKFVNRNVMTFQNLQKLFKNMWLLQSTINLKNIKNDFEAF